MSISEEAKQAAEHLWDGDADWVQKHNAEVIQQAIDAATAKLREQLAEFAVVALKNGQGLVRLEIENIKLREALDAAEERLGHLGEV